MSRTKYKIIISVINDLVTDQRVDRIAQTFYDHGHDVLVIGRLLPDSLPLNERDYKTKRMTLLFKKGPLFMPRKMKLTVSIYFLQMSWRRERKIEMYGPNGMRGSAAFVTEGSVGTGEIKTLNSGIL